MFGSISFICLLIFFHQGIMGDDVRHVVAYVNESVVLHSNADPSWKLDQIIWSVYENFTYLAFAQDEIKKINIHPLFQDRLILNEITGDLTITNVLPRDALRYRVEVVNESNQIKTSYIELSVREKLVKPHIHLRHRFLDSNHCVIMLSCSSKNSNVSLIWQPEPGFNEPTCIGPRGDTGELVLWTSFKSNQAVNFICTASNNSRSESSHMSVRCTEEKKGAGNNNCLSECTQKKSNERLIGGFIGALFGFVITCMVSLFFLQRYKKN